MLEGKFLCVQGRKKVSFGLSAVGGLVCAGSARVLYGVSRSVFRGSLTAVLVL